jgi:hypothetical protein
MLTQRSRGTLVRSGRVRALRSFIGWLTANDVGTDRGDPGHGRTPTSAATEQRQHGRDDEPRLREVSEVRHPPQGRVEL